MILTGTGSVWFGKMLRNVSCHRNRHPIPGNRAPAITMTGWHVSLSIASIRL